VTSLVFIIAMLIVLVLIAAVVLALRGSRSAEPEAPAVLSDFSGVDLNDRLAKITLSPAMREVVLPPPLDTDPLDDYRASLKPSVAPSATSVPRFMPLSAPDPRASATPGPAAPKGPRATLPGESVVPGLGTRPATAFVKPSEGPIPWAARFDRPEVAGGPILPPPMALPPSERRLGLPGRVSPEPSAVVLPNLTAEPQAEQSPFKLGGRLGLPGAAAGGFTFAGAEAVPAEAAEPATPMPRAEEVKALPGSAQPPVPDAASAQSLDIRAILRGESVPRGLPGSVADLAGRGMTPMPKPRFTTGPLPPIPEPSGALGSQPFDLRALRTAMSRPGEPAAGSAGAVRGIRGLELPGQPQGSGPAANPDATHMVGDFELPDEGFETHVFATSELIDGEVSRSAVTFEPPDPSVSEALSAGPDATEALFGGPDATEALFSGPDTTERLSGTSSTIEPWTPEPSARPALDSSGTPFGSVHHVRSYDTPSTPVPSIETPDSSEPAGDTVRISPMQEARARDLLRDLAGSADVVFVKLVSPDGVALLSLGEENGDTGLDRCIASTALAALAGAEEQGLGATNYVAIESAHAALLIAPAYMGAALAVYTCNPARLGLLRRQVRKPANGLRALLMESSVS